MILKKVKFVLKLMIGCCILANHFMLNAQKVSPINKEEIHVGSKQPALCGTDFFHESKMKTDILYKERHAKSLQSFKSIQSKTSSRSHGIYQIPVVVHVMHKGEAIGSGTNISDEDVKKGIEYLNTYWRKVLGTNGYGDGVDMLIEFALAVQDESGNCTTGINRVDMSGVSAYVNNGVNQSETSGLPDYSPVGGVNSLKEYAIWDTTKYYNIWLVDEIDNSNCAGSGTFTAGYAYYASAHGLAYDGTVALICSFLDEDSTTMAHELGHAFNLPHTFDGDDSNGDGEGDQCGDDGIFDTPSHIRTISIDPSIYYDCDNTDVNTCDPSFNETINPDTGFIRDSGTHQDHMHNYMDYTGCPTEFTGGQRAVATSALTGARSSFLSSLGLTPPALATVSFSSSASTACLGEGILFIDESSCTPNTYTNSGYDNVTFLWTIDNGVDTPYTSTDQNPFILFNNAGTYDVTLSVTNPEGTDSLTLEDYIVVSSGVVSTCSISSSNANNNYGCGVTNISFSTINNSTSTFIPSGALNDFTCSDNTVVYEGSSYQLEVDYKSRIDGGQYLAVWIDWDNDGAYQISNSNGDNERVLTDNILANSSGSPATIIVPPATAVKNALLRMRVVSDYTRIPVTCGNGYVLRADDYGVFVKPPCSPPTAGITNNSSTTVLTCLAPSISLTATGGVSYQWDNSKGIDQSITVTEAGTYTVIVSSSDGCTDTESITITEDKPAPTASITNNTGTNGLTCDITSISVTASGGISYSWDNGLGNNATATITSSGTYTVTVTASNGCEDTESITILDAATEPTSCIPSSFNSNNNFGIGVTNVLFNTINNATSTFIPADAINDFICSDNTTIDINNSYNLVVNYTTSSVNPGPVYLEVWIDWDSSGTYETTNSNGDNERIMTDNIAAGTTGTPSVNFSPPADATLGRLLRMRIISNYNSTPNVCSEGLLQRADDYGVRVENTLSSKDYGNQSSKIRLYPNPVRNELNIMSDNNGNLKRYNLFDVSGKNLMSDDFSERKTISVSYLSRGLYFIVLETDSERYTLKFLKE